MLCWAISKCFRQYILFCIRFQKGHQSTKVEKVLTTFRSWLGMSSCTVKCGLLREFWPTGKQAFQGEPLQQKPLDRQVWNIKISFLCLLLRKILYMPIFHFHLEKEKEQRSEYIHSAIIAIMHTHKFKILKLTSSFSLLYCSLIWGW